jgi:hypothetical protein
MDIAPISAIRPATMIKSPSVAPDLSRILEVEYLGESGDDEYTPADRKASRGLEDDEEEAGVETQTASRISPASSSGSVSLFA